jgi:hypothetical protein
VDESGPNQTISVEIMDLVEAHPGHRKRSLIFFTIAKQGDAGRIEIGDTIRAHPIKTFDHLYSLVTEQLTHAIIAA